MGQGVEKGNRNRLLIIWSRMLGPIIVIEILVVRAWFPSVLTDAVTLPLIVVAVLPWLALFLDSAEIGGSKLQFKKLEERQEQQEYQIRTLQFLIENFMSQSELNHLTRLNDDKDIFLFKNDWQAEFFKPELHRLRSLGLIQSVANKSLREMFTRSEAHVKEYFTITPEGKAYLKILKEFEEQVRSSRDKIAVADTLSESFK